ncbi:MAG: penicillin acylase family protein, partial [Acidobacteriota bacterium]
PTGVDLDLSQPHAEPPAPDDDDSDNSNAHNGGTSRVPAEAGESLQPGAAGNGWDAVMAALGRPACAGCAVGSNEWVISGKHTASGKPLLSNDMHIQLTEPNIWYMAGLRAPGFDAAGLTLPGYPFIIAGHNQHVAWGFTDLYADVQDLYFENIDGKGNYQAADGAWMPLRVDRETIRVRFGKDVTIAVESTDRGPLVNGLMHGPRPVALKWNLYDPSLHTIPIYTMNVAQNWAEFSAALADWCYPGQNLVYADDQGHIAYHAIGKVPLRPGGLAGVPIADHAHEWQGYIPFDDLPSAFDPPSGFLATANSRVTTGKSPYPLTLEWIDPYRVERIYKSLDGRDGLAPKDLLAVQTDIYSELDQEMGQRFAYAIDHTDGADARLRAAADLLRNWDGRVATDSAAPSIVDRAREALWPLLLKPKLGGLWKDYHWGESTFAEEQIVMDAASGWLPPGYKDWNALLTEAVRQGMRDGKAPADVRNWRYGDWHLVEVRHPLAAFVPLLGRFANTGPLPESGDTTTVKQVSPFIGPSQRFTMDWSNVDGSTENIVLGQSSDPLSPYYRDQWNAWYNGTTFALPYSAGAVRKQTTHTLRLGP